jgi:hypothetical protein
MSFNRMNIARIFDLFLINFHLYNNNLEFVLNKLFGMETSEFKGKIQIL